VLLKCNVNLRKLLSAHKSQSGRSLFTGSIPNQF